MKLIWIGVAGALGTLERYALAGAVQRSVRSSFPWGTVGVNVLGCLLIGVAWSAFESRVHITSEVRTPVLVGFLGAFTTFSAFALDTGALVRDGAGAWAFGKVVLQNAAGLAALFLGMVFGRLL